MDDPRVDPPQEADERTTLTAFLDFNRETLATSPARSRAPPQPRQCSILVIPTTME